MTAITAAALRSPVRRLILTAKTDSRITKGLTNARPSSRQPVVPLILGHHIRPKLLLTAVPLRPALRPWLEVWSFLVYLSSGSLTLTSMISGET